ncbi:hypothetical protein [Methylobacterium sp. WCS2018Hpa-22]|uniref:hypothetical protein n=1 Tax=Methylobacterium sp. WCS2018Hpa-22 TaxID=3073633 RepID=UPI00288C0164|nr:hypothetical protein [Methylobacterium sp. WCS2018Hpa-22]
MSVGSLDEAGYRIVRKDVVKDGDRWKVGFHSVVEALGYWSKGDFEIEQIAREVRALRNIVAPLNEEIERRTEHMTFDEDSDLWTVTGEADAVQRVLDLIAKGEAAEKASPVISIGGPGLYGLTPKAEAAIKDFVAGVPLTQAAVTVGSDALEREIERSFDEPLDAVADEIADQRAQAISRVIRANRLLAEAVEVLGPEAVDLLMHNLAAPDLSEAA